MNNLNGLKTILLMPLLGVFAAKFQRITGVSMTPEEQLIVAASIPTGAALALRVVTTSPVFSGLRSWIARPAKPKLVDLPVETTALLAHAIALKMSPTVVLGVEKVLARRLAEAQAKMNPAPPEGVKTDG